MVRLSVKRVVAVTGLVLVLTLSVVPAPATPEPCSTVQVMVALENGAVPDHKVVGTLCGSEGTLVILLSGATYGSEYWDFPYEPEKYSFVRALSGSYATLNIDRPGIDRSDRPEASRLTVASEAYVISQVAQAARTGSLGGIFDRVVLVGHSLGSAVAIVEQSTYHDVDGLIVTGLLPHAPPQGAPGLFAALHAAQVEERFGDRPLGYVTTRPGTREALFYHGDVDPLVHSVDEEAKQTASPFEIATIGQSASPEAEQGLDVPVLWVIGEFDNIFCPETSCARSDAPAYQEASRYPNVPRSTTYVLPGAGHSINLHRNAQDWFATAKEWLGTIDAPSINSSEVEKRLARDKPAGSTAISHETRRCNDADSYE